MNKRLLYLCAGLIVFGLAVWVYVRWYTERGERAAAPTEKEMAKLISRRYGQLPTEPDVMPMSRVDPSHPVRLAIGGFGLADDTRNRELADLVTAHLTGAKGLDLVERQSLDKALRELGMSLSGLVRAKDAIRVGKLLKAEWFLLGSSLEATNRETLVVARLVDARTGIMRDVGIFRAGTSAVNLATDLTTFVRQCRNVDSKAKPHVFLAVGSFGDVGINRRQSTFPERLSAFLTAAYQGSQLTILERDHVSAMLQEVRLDLAGLTEDSASPPPPLQSAFWTVDGFFQSFETTNHQVEVVLRVSRAFGRTSTVTLRGDPDAILRSVKESIDRTLAQGGARVVAPTRRSELRQQIETGKELFSQATGGIDPQTEPLPGNNPIGYRAQDTTARRRNLEEAVRAFNTALLLDHENHEAKFYLGACYRDRTMDRLEDARSCYRELASSPLEDRWTELATTTLAYFALEYGNYREASEWFERTAQLCKDPQQAEFCRNQARGYLGRAAELEAREKMNETVEPDRMRTLESTLFENIRAQQNRLKNHESGFDGTCGVRGFVEAFGTHPERAAKALLALLPKFREQFPEFMPHLLRAVLIYQVDTNSPVIQEFRDSLRTCQANPGKVLGAREYFRALLDDPYESPYYWSMNRGAYSLALEIAQAKREATRPFPDIAFSQLDKVRLAFAYLKLERWADALQVLDDLGDRPIVITEDGPWGSLAWGSLGLAPFCPGRAVAQCRQKLGLPPVRDPERFELEKRALRADAFALTEDGLWLAVPGKLIQLDFNLRTNLQLSLPVSTGIPVQGLCVRPTKLWVATGGSGLFEVDKASGNYRVLTEKDGLLMNQMTSLCLDRRSLWLGFGQGAAGGLGRLDLDSDRLSAFTPSLSSDPLRATAHDPQNGPPRHPVLRITCAGDQVWMLVDGIEPRRYDPAHDQWGGLPQMEGCRFDSLAVDTARMVVAFGRPQKVVVLVDEGVSPATKNARTTRIPVDAKELDRFTSDPKMVVRIKLIDQVLLQTLGIMNLNDGGWHAIPGEVPLFARPTLLALHGSDAFLGGRGYIGIFDLEKKKMRKLCYIPVVGIDRFDFGGGYLWVQFRGYLYRVPLSELQ